MVLSKRLQCIADMIPHGSRVADVGTDHGYIPIWLIQEGISESVLASDIREGPLQRAKEHARSAGVDDRIHFLLCAGLEDYTPDDVDTVIIAGMGGETIIEILTCSPWAREKTLILQPQTKIAELRRWLNEHGCRVSDASLVDDTGRIYTVWKVSAGQEEPLREIDTYIDRILVEKRDPLLLVYVEKLIKIQRGILLGQERSAAGETEELAENRRILQGLQKIREEIIHA